MDEWTPIISQVLEKQAKKFPKGKVIFIFFFIFFIFFILFFLFNFIFVYFFVPSLLN